MRLGTEAAALHSTLGQGRVVAGLRREAVLDFQMPAQTSLSTMRVVHHRAERKLSRSFSYARRIANSRGLVPLR